MKTVIFLLLGIFVVMPVMAVAFYNTIMLIAIGGYVALFVWNAKKQKKKKNLILFPVSR